MLKTFDSSAWLKIALSVAVVLWLFCLVTGLSGCAGLRPFPTDKLFEYDPKFSTCSEFRITDPAAFKFEFVRDLPLADCPPVFGFSDSDIPKVLYWARQSVAYGKSHCR